MPKNKLWYLGVDPGSAKTGVAWLEDDGTITKTAVIATEKLAAALPQIFSEGPAAVILGNGTNSANVKTMLAAAASGTDIVTVEESYRKILPWAGASSYRWGCRSRPLTLTAMQQRYWFGVI